MSQAAGRVGVDPEQVDEFGVIKSNDTSFQDLVNFKLKLETDLLTASDFSTFKNKMLNDE